MIAELFPADKSRKLGLIPSFYFVLIKLNSKMKISIKGDYIPDSRILRRGKRVRFSFSREDYGSDSHFGRERKHVSFPFSRKGVKSTGRIPVFEKKENVSGSRFWGKRWKRMGQILVIE